MEHLVTVNEFCSHHHIEISFIESLSDSGLIRTQQVHEQLFVSEDELEKLEKMVALRYHLDINLEGLEAVSHLLETIEAMQDEIKALKNRLRMFEG
ncbi:MAG: MerR family transcriptional regulator [Sphingobacteriales bacterium]|nr:MAG: MerR family transcriptional regulator [Sphingobacteriales bacterium]